MAQKIKEELLPLGLKLMNVIMVGHSMGAHICGFTAVKLNSLDEKIEMIVGLDPAGPLFEHVPEEQRLNKTQAKYVEVYHTSKILGIQKSIGHSKSIIYFGNKKYRFIDKYYFQMTSW